MRRTLAILALSGLVATVAGAASHLGVDSANLQYGTDTTSCDADGVQVHWGLENNGGLVYNARVSGVDAGCTGASMFVNVLGANDAIIFELEGAAANSTLRFPTPISAKDIFGVEVGIEGIGTAPQ